MFVLEVSPETLIVRPPVSSVMRHLGLRLLDLSGLVFSSSTSLRRSLNWYCIFDSFDCMSSKDMMVVNSTNMCSAKKEVDTAYIGT